MPVLGKQIGAKNSFGKLAGGSQHDRLRRCIPVECNQQLSDARQGDELLAVQVAGEFLQTGTILGRLAHVGGKLSLYARTTARTLLYLCLMLCHFDAGGRNVEYLPFLMPLGSLCLQLCLAARAIRFLVFSGWPLGIWGCGKWAAGSWPGVKGPVCLNQGFRDCKPGFSRLL